MTDPHTPSTTDKGSTFTAVELISMCGLAMLALSGWFMVPAWLVDLITAGYVLRPGERDALVGETRWVIGWAFLAGASCYLLAPWVRSRRR